jgi:uncharacterized protein (DUF2384 family)
MKMPKINKNSDRLIMDVIAKQMTSYAATQWLKSPNKSLNDQAPSDLMREGKADVVYKQLKKEIKHK